MKRTAALCALAFGLAACGDGNPFSATTTSTGTGGSAGGTSAIPETIASDLGSFTFNPTDGTLTVEGVFLDADGVNGVFVRKPGLDQAGYIAFTSQDDALDQHVTAYVQDINGTRGGVVLAGGQFGTFNGGAAYAREGTFDPPGLTGDPGLVTYAGSYIGLSNIDNDGGDLIAPPAGTDSALIPGQAGTITGRIFINVDFNDNSLKGSIIDRVLDADDGRLAPGTTTLAVNSIDLLPGTIASDGTFSGDAVLTNDPDNDDIGDYGGIFGGTDAEVMAGAIYLEDHLVSDTNADVEYGTFVLGACGSAVETGGTLCTGVDGVNQ